MTSTQTRNSPDIDRGWAFVVLFFGVIMTMLSRGMFSTVAILYVIFLEEFQQSPVFTAWAVNVNIFCSFFLTIFANILLLKVGSRYNVIIGCVLSTMGLLCCSFAKSLTVVFLTYGLLTGIGFACGHLSALSIIPKYFNRYRIIAFTFMSSGNGAGQILYAPLFQALKDEYNWRWAFIILAGINLNMLAISASFMKPRQEILEDEEEDDQDTNVRNVFRKLFQHSTIFRNPYWILLCISNTLYNIGIAGFTTHISNYGRINGLSETQQAFVLSMFGIGSLSARLIIGSITQILKLPVPLIFMTMTSVLGIMSIVISFVDSVIGIITCSFMAGTSLTAFAIGFEVILMIIGEERFSSGFSFLLLFGSIGAISGGPLAARIYVVDPSYRWSYRIVGVISLMGTALLLPIVLTPKYKTKPKLDAEKDNDHETVELVDADHHKTVELVDRHRDAKGN